MIADRSQAPDLGRNRGIPLDLEWINNLHANRSAIERRAATLPARRTVKREWQAAWLLRAISCIDLTTLGGDDTPGTVRRLCAKATRPLRSELLDALAPGRTLRVAAVCVYHDLVPVAVESLAGADIPVAAVAAGFPHGLSPLSERVREVEASVAAGAREIDVVIARRHALLGDWRSLYDEVRVLKEACGDALLKVILATGELGTLRCVARASTVCMMAGADFVKTSTGKEATNATLSVGIVMARAIREFRERTGYRVGLKPAGGVRVAKQALEWLTLMREELGLSWSRPDLFRIGASALLGDVERQLEHFVTGRYSAFHRHPHV